MEFSNIFTLILSSSLLYLTLFPSLKSPPLSLFPLSGYCLLLFCLPSISGLLTFHSPNQIMCALLFLFLSIFNPPTHQWFPLYCSGFCSFPGYIHTSEDVYVRASSNERISICLSGSWLPHSIWYFEFFLFT